MVAADQLEVVLDHAIDTGTSVVLQVRADGNTIDEVIVSAPHWRLGAEFRQYRLDSSQISQLSVSGGGISGQLAVSVPHSSGASTLLDITLAISEDSDDVLQESWTTLIVPEPPKARGPRSRANGMHRSLPMAPMLFNPQQWQPSR